MFCFCLSSDEREAVMVHLKQVSFKRYKLYMCFMHALLKGCGHSTKCILFNCVLPTVETVEEQIVRQLTEKRINDLNESLAETKEEYLYVQTMAHSQAIPHSTSFPGHAFPTSSFCISRTGGGSGLGTRLACSTVGILCTLAQLNNLFYPDILT